MPDPVFDAQRNRVPIGALLGRGGEGAVYALPNSDQVVKVFHQPLLPAKVEKLTVMIRGRTSEHHSYAAWPTKLLFDGRGRPVGLQMPRATGVEHHLLYTPMDRLERFPNVSWAFLIRVATNVARAFQFLHSKGIIIGDVNDGSILVLNDAIVRLVDCDSFQISSNGKIYPCDVGFPPYTPPELQSVSLAGKQRTINHDSFSLAVVVFRLLALGRHPFVGRFLGVGEMPMEQAIKELRFAFARDAAKRLMEPPPNSLTSADFPRPISDLFERAFLAGRDAQRPTAKDWISGLQALSKDLVVCPQNGNHMYAAARGCPWCRIERGTGIVLFNFPSVPAAPPVDFDGLWKAIEEAAQLVPAPQYPIPRRRGPSTPARPGIRNAFTPWRWGRGKQERRLLAEAVKRCEIADRRWDAAVAADRRLAKKLHELQAIRGEYLTLPSQRAALRRQLETSRRQQQLTAHLRARKIPVGVIDGIGPGRQAVLVSHWITSAEDITRSRVLAVPGFGDALTGNLLDWRRRMEQSFTFNPNAPVDPNAVAAIEAQIEKKARPLLQALRNGPDALRALKQTILTERERAAEEVAQALAALNRAEQALQAALAR